MQSVGSIRHGKKDGDSRAKSDGELEILEGGGGHGTEGGIMVPPPAYAGRSRLSVR